MQFIDTHIHLQDYKSSNATDIINAAIASGCKKLVCVSANVSDWEKVAVLCDEYPEVVVPAFGIHPWYAAEATRDWKERLAVHLRRFPQALIGECGIDLFKNKDITLQSEVFVEQIELAKSLERPLIVHAVRAQSWFQNNWDKMPEKFVIHSFGGSVEFLRQIMARGGYVGLSALSLRKQALPEILAAVNPQRLLVETDAPSQSLQRGKEGQQQEVAQIIATLEKISDKAWATQIYQNSEEFIGCQYHQD